jgi:hypothetical protein
VFGRLDVPARRDLAADEGGVATGVETAISSPGDFG